MRLHSIKCQKCGCINYFNDMAKNNKIRTKNKYCGCICEYCGNICLKKEKKTLFLNRIKKESYLDLINYG